MINIGGDCGVRRSQSSRIRAQNSPNSIVGKIVSQLQNKEPCNRALLRIYPDEAAIIFQVVGKTKT